MDLLSANPQKRTETARAAFILGCLVEQDLFPFDLDSETNRDNFFAALQLVEACLTHLHTDRDDLPELPFRC